MEKEYKRTWIVRDMIDGFMKRFTNQVDDIVSFPNKIFEEVKEHNKIHKELKK